MIVIRSVNETLAALSRLRANVSWAASVAAAGQRFAARYLRMEWILDYFRELLAQYAAAQQGTPRVSMSGLPLPITPGFTRVATPKEIGWATLLCNCSERSLTSWDARNVQCTAQGAPTHPHWQARVRCCKGWDCPVDVCGLQPVLAAQLPAAT